jgi:putative ABC transport system permease protein
MFSYNLRLALKSLRRTPGVAALMIGAIGLGVGVCVTTLTVWRVMSSNPILHKNDVL